MAACGLFELSQVIKLLLNLFIFSFDLVLELLGDPLSLSILFSNNPLLFFSDGANDIPFRLFDLLPKLRDLLPKLTK
jgi:hypothetical protein